MNRSSAARQPGLFEDEAVLVAALRGGDDRAFEFLVVHYGGRMLATSRRLLRNEEDAKDALQEAFIQAFRAVHRFEGLAQLSTWLHRIVINSCLMRMRSRKARPEESIEEMLPRFAEDGHSVKEYQDWPESAERMIERREVRELVRATIERLPETHRTVLMLRDIEELDTATVAELLGITENAVKIRLHRARQALREQIDPRLREA
ncbi:MAG TPA: sigma-70 family RNA polymerase sigma factor [Thermoanaerobaculia bacterium]|nr:sigma-70 family RNA polymerase sigma factor [Thermoanaerobaculia bacterium]